MVLTIIIVITSVILLLFAASLIVMYQYRVWKAKQKLTTGLQERTNTRRVFTIELTNDWEDSSSSPSDPPPSYDDPPPYPE